MKYISVDEVLMGRIKIEELSPELLSNLNTIVPRVNELLEKFGQYRKVNSGYRSIEDQKRINPKATHSMHLKCAAVDLEDKDRKLTHFCLNNLKLLESIGLWMEDPNSTNTWVHLQCYPPKSGRRIFIP
jgi:hypothetical protein